MTALFMDGYDHYGTGLASATNMLAGPYTSVAAGTTCATPPWGAARTGSYCLRTDSSANTGARHALASPSTHYFISLGFAVDNLSFVPTRVVDFLDGGASSIVYVIPTTTGAIEVRLGDQTLIGTTSGPAITAENWHFFELEVNTSAHTLVLRIDDPSAGNTPILSITNAGITGTIAQVAVLTTLNGHAGGVSNVDDLFIRDGSGSINNGFLGDRRIATSLVDADTTTAGWTPNYYQKLGTGILNSTPASSAVYTGSGGTHLNIGAADFTLETFHRFQALPTSSNKATIFSLWDETHNQRSYQLFLGSVALNGGSLQFRTSTDGTNSTVANPIIYPWTPNLDQWYHIAIVRASGELLLFVDGQQLGLPIADSSTYFAGTSWFGLGSQAEQFSAGVAGAFFQGWFDEFRFTNGFARYTTNFTPTTVEFPRSGSDPHWTDVVTIMGFDSVIQDESQYAIAYATQNALQFTPNDGPGVGAWSTIGKAVPDDNTFIAAPFVPATSILTLTVNASNTNTVTVGTTDGTTPAVYTFKTSLSTAFDVLIDTNIQNTLQNLYNAINAGPGAGTKYGTSTTANNDVFATQLPAGQMQVTASIAGTGGNSIATSKTGITGGWTSTTLAGGLDIPGPSNFRLQRLPPTTTLVSAIQIVVRASKSDAGLGSINSALVGPLGGVGTSPTHNLTISPNYYNDIHEIDPDTSGPISPTTITGGSIQINRDT